MHATFKAQNATQTLHLPDLKCLLSKQIFFLKTQRQIYIDKNDFKKRKEREKEKKRN